MIFFSRTNSLGRKANNSALSINSPIFWYFIAAIFISFLYAIPKDIAINAHDFYDSYVAYLHLRPPLHDTIFRMDAESSRAINGWPLNQMAIGELTFASLIYAIFPHYWDTAIHLWFSTFLLFWTIFKILVQSLPDRLKKSHAWIAGFVALYFCAVYINPIVLSAIIGVNLIILGLLKVNADPCNNKNIWYFVAAPFIAQAPMGPVFYYPILLVVCFTWLRGMAFRKGVFYIFISMVLMVFFDYRVFISSVFDQTVTNRESWLVSHTGNPFEGLFNKQYWVSGLTQSTDLLLKEQAHYGWNPKQVTLKGIGIATVVSLIFVLVVLVRGGVASLRQFISQQKEIFKSLAIVFGLLFMVCFFYGIWSTSIVDLWTLTGLTLQANRGAMVFAPIIGALCLFFALVVSERSIYSAIFKSCESSGRGPAIFQIFLFALLGISAALSITVGGENFTRRYANAKHQLKYMGANPYISYPTMGTYYLDGTFTDLKEFLGENWRREKVISIGLDPMVASFNGFQHLDGYFQLYPQSYKDEFRKIIAPEFEIDATNKNYYDGWGLRVYAFVGRYEGSDILININICQFTKMGGTLVLAGRKIANPEDSGMVFETEVTGLNRGLMSTVYLYRPNTASCAKTI